MAQLTPASGAYEPPPTAALWMMRVLALVSVLLSTWLLLISLTQSGAEESEGVMRVLTMRWATWLGMPISVFGMVIYLAIFVATMLVGAGKSAQTHRTAWAALLVLCVVAAGAGLWFMLIQFTNIKNLMCFRCMAIHGSGLALAFMVAMFAPIHSGRGRARPWMLGMHFSAGLAAIGLMSVAAMAGGQLIASERSKSEGSGDVSLAVLESDGTSPFGAPPSVAESHPYVATPATDSTLADQPPTEQVPTRPDEAIVKFDKRTLEFMNGKIRNVDRDELAVLGSSEAPNVVLFLFDYTHNHCALMYWHLQKVLKRYGSQLAVAFLPAPMNTDCNEHRKKPTAAIHVDACDLAKIGMRVWLADPEKFAAFNGWMFATGKAPQPRLARVYAEQIVGEAKFSDTEGDPWIDTQIANGTKYHNMMSAKLKPLPGLITPTKGGSGGLERPERLYDWFEQEFDIKPVVADARR